MVLNFIIILYLTLKCYRSIVSSEILPGYSLVENKLTEQDRKVLSEKLNSNKIAYRCDEKINIELFKIDLSHTQYTLTEENLLKTLENKRLGIVGDSIGWHLYNALYTFLHAYELPLSPDDLNKNKGNVRKRIIYQYNVTIYWCKDALVNEFFVKKTYLRKQCGKEVVNHSDFLIMAFGTWYKPKFFLNPTKNKLAPTDFMLNMMQNEQLVHNLIDNIYSALSKYKPSLTDKILWRLQPHVGNIDEHREQVFEYSSSNSTVTKITLPEHSNGLYWTNIKRDSTWVRRFNDVIRYQAYRYNHSAMLDWHALSYLYIDYFSKHKPNVQIHFDSMHYCLAGVPRGSLLQLLVTLKQHFHL